MPNLTIIAGIRAVDKVLDGATGLGRVWRAGRIIRAGLLGDIMTAFERNPALPNLLLHDAFRDIVVGCQPAWREIVRTAVELGIPMLATSASLAYFDAYRSERL